WSAKLLEPRLKLKGRNKDHQYPDGEARSGRSEDIAESPDFEQAWRVAKQRQKPSAQDGPRNGRQTEAQHCWPIDTFSKDGALEDVVEQMDDTRRSHCGRNWEEQSESRKKDRP